MKQEVGNEILHEILQLPNIDTTLPFRFGASIEEVRQHYHDFIDMGNTRKGRLFTAVDGRGLPVLYFFFSSAGKMRGFSQDIQSGVNDFLSAMREKYGQGYDARGELPDEARRKSVLRVRWDLPNDKYVIFNSSNANGSSLNSIFIFAKNI